MITPSAPNTTALRIIAPRLCGSSMPSSTTSTGFGLSLIFSQSSAKLKVFKIAHFGRDALAVLGAYLVELLRRHVVKGYTLFLGKSYYFGYGFAPCLPGKKTLLIVCVPARKSSRTGFLPEIISAICNSNNSYEKLPSFNLEIFNTSNF